MIKIKQLLIFFVFFIFLPHACFCEYRKAVTHTGGDRLGDKLVDYIHAKWVSYKWGYPLFYQPFKYSDQLILHDQEKILTSRAAKSFACRFTVKDVNQLDQDYNTLFEIFHFPDSYDEYVQIGWAGFAPYIPVDWTDTKFRDRMRALIYPKYPLSLISPPKDVISVALHYRNGGGVDDNYVKSILPLRFPINEYYFEQLKNLHSLVNNDSLYVFIFTDHPNPSEIKQMFLSRFPNNITFDCRATSSHNSCVLEDLFSMMNFDCLIRPISHYSSVASHLKDFKIEISPKHGHYKNHSDISLGHIIDETYIIQRATWDLEKKEWRSNDVLTKDVIYNDCE
jgi:hypothetical protein